MRQPAPWTNLWEDGGRRRMGRARSVQHHAAAAIPHATTAAMLHGIVRGQEGERITHAPHRYKVQHGRPANVGGEPEA
eukprot:1159058-Pelagomonas_calceolata.AAC.4